MRIKFYCALVLLFLQALLAGASSVSSLRPAVNAVDGALLDLQNFVEVAVNRSPSYLELAARDVAYSLARIYAGRCQTRTYRVLTENI